MKELSEEEKELLLKDLCARLSYEVILLAPNGKISYETDSNTAVELFVEEGWKPYLRSLSSMTEEEKNEHFGRTMTIDIVQTSKEVIDWLNAHHFDYRGLIEKGLAIEAPEGIYN